MVRLGRFREQFNPLRHHKTRIKTQAKVANNGIVFLLVFFKKIFSTRKSNLIDITLHFICGHTNSVVGNGESFGFTVYLNFDRAIITLAAVSGHSCHSPLADGIYTIADQLPEKHLMA